uniref:DNK domain-containing protein n=2 Tax=Mesocestoides corti TaxID=53468 RepID=A0A5K3FNJ7_MESCO
MDGKEITVAVEGNIGCGKSTFLRFFESIYPDIEVMPEPIGQWRDAKGHNIFEMFYSDPRKYNSPFRAQVMVTLLNQLAQPRKSPIRLIERSIHSNRFCFIEAIKKSGLISDGDFQVLDECYEWSRHLPVMKLDLIVYLQSTPEICAERIRKRSRKGEESISMGYLQELHDLHEDWLLGEKSTRLPAPVLVFDCSEPLEKVTSNYYNRRDEVFCGIKV